MDRCFFCDCLIIPKNIITISEVKEFFSRNNLEFTLNYNRSRVKIGNKFICGKCELQFREFLIIEEECDCLECRKNKDD